MTADVRSEEVRIIMMNLIIIILGPFYATDIMT